MSSEGVRSPTFQEALSAPAERRLRDLPRLVRQALAVVWEAARRELIITASLQAVSSVVLAAQILITKELLTHLLDGGEKGYGPAVPYIIALAVAIGIVGVANTARAEVQYTLNELVSRYTMGKVIEVSTAVDLMAFETPAFHDRQQRALINATARPLQMTNGMLGLIGSLLATIGIGLALLAIQPLFLALVAVSFVPIWLVTITASRAMYRYAVDQTERDRRRLYLQMILTNKETAKEIRVYDNEGFLRSRYDDLYARRIADLRHVVRRRIRRGTTGAVLTGVLTGAALGLIVVFLSDGSLSLADAGAAAGGIILLAAQLQGIAQSAGSLYESSLFIRDFTTFLAMLPTMLSHHGEDPVPPGFDVVSARDVSFTYPSRTRPSLHSVSIDLPRGQVVALVGENGSGKTTLAKLLAGLYPPSAGTVAWDGVDIATFAPAQLRPRVAVLFQDFVRYHLSALENIGFGNHALADDETAVRQAASAAGADAFLSELPHGYATLLGPEYYGGSDLSGGQWQRVALARAFLRDAQLIILDEPTAALDPRSEAELYGRVRELFAGRTVLLISHRFASVRLADRIYVLEEGRVIEHGDHESLMRRSGAYAEMFTLQAAAYALDEAEAAAEAEGNPVAAEASAREANR
jgi:ATP-binding cassette, subfamily B, bacterial